MKKNTKKVSVYSHTHCNDCGRLAWIFPGGEEPKCFKCQGYRLLTLRLEWSNCDAFGYAYYTDLGMDNPDPKQCPNAVQQAENGKWWFWDETWCQNYGPYNTEEEAIEALKHYCDTEL